MKRADLHLHTNLSDGICSPLQLVEEVRHAGIDCIAITDHDTMDAVSIVEEVVGGSIEVIAGVELSSELNAKEIHILGYYIERSSSSFQQLLDKMRKIRTDRVYVMVAKLKDLGVDLSVEDVLRIAGEGSVGRLHIARAMVAKGFVSNIYEAFAKYIGDNCPAYVSKFLLTPKEAIQAILDADGIPVLAHPNVMKCDELIPDFVEAGLKGLEVYYPEHKESVIKHYLGIAQRYNLLVTGGSDFHGSAKPDIYVGKVSIPYELVERMKEVKYGKK